MLVNVALQIRTRCKPMQHLPKSADSSSASLSFPKQQLSKVNKTSDSLLLQSCKRCRNKSSQISWCQQLFQTAWNSSRGRQHITILNSWEGCHENRVCITLLYSFHPRSSPIARSGNRLGSGQNKTWSPDGASRNSTHLSIPAPYHKELTKRLIFSLQIQHVHSLRNTENCIPQSYLNRRKMQYHVQEILN